MMDENDANRVAIKNMVCPRCIRAVEEIVARLKLHATTVELGSVEFPEPLTEPLRLQLEQELGTVGFELVEEISAKRINAIRSLVVKWVHFEESSKEMNLSDYLSSKLNYEYSVLSKLFSSVEGMTIERYAMLQRIERAKELLVYRQRSVTEISDLLGFSSPAHFTNRFKTETGMTPSAFRKLIDPPRRSIDSF